MRPFAEVLLLFYVFSCSNSTFVEDLDSIFLDKHCIEASLIPILPADPIPVMIDSPVSVTQTELIRNPTFTKSVTSRVNELAQFNKIEATYKLISETGPPHAKIFTVKLTLGSETYKSSGPSLKKAKEEAAKLALEDTSYELPPEKIKDEKLQTPTVILNNIASKLGIAVTYFLINGKEETSIESYGANNKAFGGFKSAYDKVNQTANPFRVPLEDSHVTGPFTVKVKVGDFAFQGFGHTIQAAKHDAALKAIQEMEKQALFQDNVCSKDESTVECREKKEGLKSAVSRVFEAGQKHNLNVDFKIIDESGKSHQKLFVTQCTLGEFVTEGEGASKKESKRISAENMLQYLPHLPKKFDKGMVVNSLTKKKSKKRKMVRESKNNLVETVAKVASSLWKSGDASDTSSGKSDASKKSPRSAKETVLEVASKLNIGVDFTDLKQDGNVFCSLITLELTPSHICLGKALTRDRSHEAAALHGLKFLKSNGLLDKPSLLEYKNLDKLEEFEFEETWHRSLEEIDKKSS